MQTETQMTLFLGHRDPGRAALRVPRPHAWTLVFTTRRETPQHLPGICKEHVRPTLNLQEMLNELWSLALSPLKATRWCGGTSSGGLKWLRRFVQCGTPMGSILVQADSIAQYSHSVVSGSFAVLRTAARQASCRSLTRELAYTQVHRVGDVIPTMSSSVAPDSTGPRPTKAVLRNRLTLGAWTPAPAREVTRNEKSKHSNSRE